jgi:hypothetical protein
VRATCRGWCKNAEGFVNLKFSTYPLIRQGFKSLAHSESPLKRTKYFLYNDFSPLVGAGLVLSINQQYLSFFQLNPPLLEL